MSCGFRLAHFPLDVPFLLCGRMIFFERFSSFLAKKSLNFCMFHLWFSVGFSIGVSLVLVWC